MGLKSAKTISGARCFRKDLKRIKAFSKILSLKEDSAFHQEHVISRALDAYAEKIKSIFPQNDEEARTGIQAPSI